MKEKIEEETSRLLDNCHKKRTALLSEADTSTKRRRQALIASSLLSLLSAITLTSVVVSNVSQFYGQVISIVLAATGGLISIFLGVTHRETEIHGLYDGAAKYQALRERVNIDENLAGNLIFPEDGIKVLKGYINEYIALSQQYDRYIPIASSLVEPDTENIPKRITSFRIGGASPK